MPYAHNGNVDLYSEVEGPADGPTAIVVNGYGAQLTGWPAPFVTKLTKAGIRAVLMDNRDAGLSSQTGTPDQTTGTYTMGDMADDVVAVAEAAGAPRFHVIGQSMGGMIAQQLLADHQDALVSATMFYTAPSFGPQWATNAESQEVVSHSGLAPIDDPEQAIASGYQRMQMCREGSAYPIDEDALRALARRQYERCYRPDGTARQLTAIEGFGVTDDQLAAVTIPTSVWHGKADPYFGPQAAWHIATHIPTAELHLFPGMAHEIPLPLIPTFVEGIARQVLGAEA